MWGTQGHGRGRFCWWVLVCGGGEQMVARMRQKGTHVGARLEECRSGGRRLAQVYTVVTS